MLWRASFIQLFILSIAAVGSLEAGRGTTRSNRIKVPLGRRLADVIAAATTSDAGDDDYPSNGPTSTTSTARRFEIEANDDTTTTNNDGATTTIMYVEEINQMPVTSQTTYSFHKTRQFHSDKINDIVILASNPNDDKEVVDGGGGGLTIMSIDKSTGDVRGIQRGNMGHTRQISMDHDSRKLRIRRSLSGDDDDEVIAAKNWTCGAAHAHDDYYHDERSGDHYHFDLNGNAKQRDFATSSSRSSSTTTASNNNNNVDYPAVAGSTTTGAWIEPTKYSFHVDLSIDIDKRFIEKQGGAEAAVEYINFLVGAANVVFEHEIDTHCEYILCMIWHMFFPALVYLLNTTSCIKFSITHIVNVVHIQETDIYDTLTTAKEGLRAQRLHPRPKPTNGESRIVLYHALLGRYLGGGIAFIDSICDKSWGYGVTSDISGTLSNINELVFFDFFIMTHEIGHSLGSGHTFDAYDPPVDDCGNCTIKPQSVVETTARVSDVTIEGLPLQNAATLMSYCNFCQGGLSNIAITLGGVWDGVEPRTDIDRWQNHPDIVGSVSVEPRRVSHNTWQILASKGECVKPPSDPLPFQECNDDNDCDDGNMCSIDVCNESNSCAVTEIFDDCCGNGKCEPGEIHCSSDCGPFKIQAPNSCYWEDCHSLDGFMIDVGLNDEAERRVFVSSVTLEYSSPETNAGATINVYVTTEGSFLGKEESADNWERIKTVTVARYNAKRGTRFIEIDLLHSIPLGIGGRRGLYFAASEDIIMFGEGLYSIRNDHKVELHSSRAVSGLFGDGIDGFGLNIEVSYLLDDSSLFSTDARISKTSSPPTSSLVASPSLPMLSKANRQSENDHVAFSPSSSEDEYTSDEDLKYSSSSSEDEYTSDGDLKSSSSNEDKYSSDGDLKSYSPSSKTSSEAARASSASPRRLPNYINFMLASVFLLMYIALH
ncbi:hypothetical protein ACHAXR_007675 [Thalassiosira sp. AJA248-18]